MGIEMAENAGEQDKEELSSHVIRHFCKVCNRGFGCAGALGGHMRAHVIMGDHHLINEKPESSNNNNNKHSYFLRAKTTSRNFMGYRNLSDHFEEGDDFLRKSSSSSQHNFDHYEYNNSANSSEDEDLANCLVMLSNNDKSCNNNINSSSNNNEENHHKAKEVVMEKGNMFQCKACKKVFNSHQALGGHRASHKKVKGCFAAKTDIIGNLNDELDELERIQEEDHHHEQPIMHTPSSSTTSNPRKPRAKMHECSVCRRVFSSGQALGGHKRCHWLTTSTDNAFIPNFHDHFQYHHQQQQQQNEQLYKKPILTNSHHERNLDSHNDYNNINHDLDLNLNLPTHAGDLHSHDTSRYHEEESTRLYLQKFTNHKKQKIENDGQKSSCEMKLRKLSDLRDVNLDGSWLQVGITSTTDIY